MTPDSNPHGIHCDDCRGEQPCAACAEQIEAERAYHAALAAQQDA